MNENEAMTEIYNRANIPIWKSYVWYNDKCFFVSTIERTYDTYEGESRGNETLVWKYDWDKRERGEWLGQGDNHIDTCTTLIKTGLLHEDT